MMRTIAVALILAGLLGTAHAALPRAAAGERYPYGSPAFLTFVADSYAQPGAAGTRPFSSWFDDAVMRYAQRSFADVAVARRLAWSSAARPQARAALELDAARWGYGFIKTAIPRFSLDRGYEFTNVVRYGERQCLLQAVLLASMLQAMGLDAGVFMVWQNARGEVSNNGHAVAVLKLSDGRDVLVDASESEPFFRHRGVFVRDRNDGQYRFVHPMYNADGTIAGYGAPTGDVVRAPAAVRPLDVGFLRSQFYYYRGERTPGGVLLGPSTPAGLMNSERYLETAQVLQAANPLVVYMLGTAYLKLGRRAAARAQYARGYTLYQAYGFVPDGPKNAYLQSGY